MEINKGAKVGIMIELIALVIIILLILFNKTIPSLVNWVFVAGLVISLSGTLVASAKKNNKIWKSNISICRGNKRVRR